MGGGREGKVGGGSRGTTRIPRTVVFGELLRNTRPRGPVLRESLVSRTLVCRTITATREWQEFVPSVTLRVVPSRRTR